MDVSVSLVTFLTASWQRKKNKKTATTHFEMCWGDCHNNLHSQLSTSMQGDSHFLSPVPHFKMLEISHSVWIKQIVSVVQLPSQQRQRQLWIGYITSINVCYIMNWTCSVFFLWPTWTYNFEFVLNQFLPPSNSPWSWPWKYSRVARQARGRAHPLSSSGHQCCPAETLTRIAEFLANFYPADRWQMWRNMPLSNISLV